MGNGQSELYKLTAGEWMEMNTSIKLVGEKLDQLDKTDKAINITLTGINDTLNSLPCEGNVIKIDALEKRPSANKAIIIIGSIITLLIAVFGIIKAVT